jgi:DNA-directed RNA polymerase specialized sigma24 family protein
LDRLAAVDARKAQVIELRYFRRPSLEETAEALHLTVATVRRDCRPGSSVANERKCVLKGTRCDELQTSDPA